MFVEDCVEGTMRVMNGDYEKPLNLGTEYMLSMNDLAHLVMDIAQRGTKPLKHIPGPEGVRGRNSDNTLLRKELGWEPQWTLNVGLSTTYKWIKEQVDKESVTDQSQFATSEVVKQVEDSLLTHSKGGGERPTDVGIKPADAPEHGAAKPVPSPADITMHPAQAA